MESYTGFAEFYDLFMDNVPYEQWGEYLNKLFKEYGIEDGLLLDLGCGTGLELEFYFPLNPAAKITGIDLSKGMLNAMREKFPYKNISLICGSYFDVPFGENAFDACLNFSIASTHLPQSSIGASCGFTIEDNAALASIADSFNFSSCSSLPESVTRVLPSTACLPAFSI